MNYKKIYVSGKMNGLSKTVYTEIFSKAVKYLKQTYPKAVIINPVDLGNDIDESAIEMNFVPTLKDYIMTDLIKLAECDAIYMLTNWVDSDGAKLEKLLAEYLKMAVLYESIHKA